MAEQGEEDPSSYTGISWIKTGFKKFVNLAFEGVGPPECKMPGCNQPCYVENDGRVHEFCGRSHAREYRAMEEAEWQEQMRKRQEAHDARDTRSRTTVDNWEYIGHDNRFSPYPASFEGII